MRILGIGLDYFTLSSLRKRRMVIESQTVEDISDLELWLAQKESYDACLIDLNTPGFCDCNLRSLRVRGICTPIIGLSNKVINGSWSEQRAQFLENGGDDLLHQRASSREITASLRAARRRYDGALLDFYLYKKGGATLEIDHSQSSVLINGMCPKLSEAELKVLLAITMSPGRIVLADTIINRIYESVDDSPHDGTIRVLISRIRHKFKDIHKDAWGFIENAHGNGYRVTGDTINSGLQIKVA